MQTARGARETPPPEVSTRRANIHLTTLNEVRNLAVAPVILTPDNRRIQRAAIERIQQRARCIDLHLDQQGGIVTALARPPDLLWLGHLIDDTEREALTRGR
jgi:hypothetical protein